jgi:orotate phosphoribosyltransferase-like protein
MTLSQELRSAVIQRAEQGKQYREISKNLNISVGSIVNIIKNYKTENGHEQPSPIQVKPIILQAQNPELQKQELQDMPDIDFYDEPYDYDVFTDPNVDYDETYYGVQGERRFANQYPTFPKPSRRLEISDTDYDNRVVTKIKKVEENSEESYQHQPRISASEDSSLGLGIDWDSNHQTRFVKWVMYEKKLRQGEERKIQEQWGGLLQERNSLEDLKRDLDARETKLSEVKDLIPSAAELKSMGVEFSHAIAWINVIREYASKKMVDERTATWKLAEDLKNWQELGGFENVIQNAKNQLALLNMTLEDQKAAIATLVNLQKMGMSEIEISRLVKLVNGWGKGNGNFANGLELDSRLNLQNTAQ